VFSRFIKCITHENPPQGRCERCERKDLKCEYVTVADEEAQVVSSSQSSSPELSRSYHKLQNEAPYYPNPTNVDPQWSRKFPEAYCSDDLTSYLANPQNISSHYTGPLQPQQSRPQPSYTGLSPDPYASPYHLVAGGFGQDYNGHRGLTTTTSPDPWSPSLSHSSAHAQRDNSAYLFGSHHQNARCVHRWCLCIQNSY